MIGVTGVALGGVILAVLAAMGFALEAILAKRGIAAGGSPILASLMVAGIAIIVYWAAVGIVVDLSTFMTRDTSAFVVFLFAGAVGSGLGILAIYQGVDRVGASVNTAVVNSRPLFAAILGFLFLGETLAPTTVFGIIVLVGGLIVIVLSKGGDITGWQASDLLFPLLAASAFAIGNVVRRYGLTRIEISVVEAIAINAVGGFAVLACYVAFIRGPSILYAPRRAYLWFTCTGLTTALALLALFGALERERVAIVDSIAATAPLFALLLTVVFLRELEVVTLRVLLGVGLVVGGGVLIVGL